MTPQQIETLVTAAKPIIEAAESRIPHFYLDGRRNVTVAAGHRVANAACALLLELDPASAIAADFARVLASPVGYRAAWYGSLCDSRMTDAAIDKLLDTDARRFVGQLAARLPQLASYKLLWQEAVLDMGYNLGVGGFMEYRQLIAALDAGDGETAAEQCYRHGLGDTPQNWGSRNLQTAEMFRG